MANNLPRFQGLYKSGDIKGDVVELTLASYNARLGNILNTLSGKYSKISLKLLNTGPPYFGAKSSMRLLVVPREIDVSSGWLPPTQNRKI